jgi:hypothetical protein
MLINCAETDVVRNLEDAGCNADIITTFIDYMREGKTAESVRLLNQHRKFLLDVLHKDQRQIDCLDYLIHQIKRET